MIELAASPEVRSRDGKVRVIVRAERRRRRHVVLLLRLDDRLMTYVQTQRLRGTLDLVVCVCCHYTSKCSSDNPVTSAAGVIDV